MTTTTLIRTITFARHGQSEQNVIKPEKISVTEEQLLQFQNRDSGDHRLTNHGITDGQAVGEILRRLEMSFSLLAVSTFVRAQETLLATGLEGNVEISPLLDERFTGEHEPLLMSEAKRRFPNAGKDRRRKETRWRPENGESMRDVLTRTLLFMEHLKSLPGGNEHVLIIGHARVIGTYMWWAEQLEDHEVPGMTDGEHTTNEVVNGQVVQYGWAHSTLRPTHKRVFIPGSEIDHEWKPLAPDARFTAHDLRRMINQHPRILSE